MLEDLKQKGEALIRYADLDAWAGDMLKRVEPRPIPFTVLLNNQRVELPAVHAKGLGGTEFYFLNDPENPIVLAWQLGKEIGKLQVIKISLASEVPSRIAGAGGSPPGSGGGGGSGASAGSG